MPVLVADFEPISGLTFRDARPFQAGESVAARNIAFPPPPTAFWHAARVALRQQGLKAGLTVRSFGLVVDKTAYLPAPLDLRREVQKKGVTGKTTVGGQPRWFYLAPVREASKAWMDSDLRPLVTRVRTIPPENTTIRADKVESLAGQFLNLDAWARYLSGKEIADLSSSASRFVKPGMRVRVQLEDRKAKHGMLFSEEVLTVDPKVDFRFRVGLEVDGDTVPHEPSFVPLGGESRLAHVSFSGGFAGGTSKHREECRLDDRVKERVQAEILKKSSDGKPIRVKVCLVTPAIYSANLYLLQKKRSDPNWRTPAWRPHWLPSDGRAVEHPFGDPYSLRLVSAVLEKSIPLGFWDSNLNFERDSKSGAVKERRSGGPGAPKPLYRFLPAGAVYFLELGPIGVTPERALEQFFDRFWFRSILLRGARQGDVRKSGRLAFFGKKGYGIAVLGGWDYV